MIQTLTLENYKRHASTELALAPFTLLVGPNGSGKTSVLEALHLLSALDIPFGSPLPEGSSVARVARRQPGVASLRAAVTGRSAAAARALDLRLNRAADGHWHPTTSVVGGAVEGAIGHDEHFTLPHVGPIGYWPELHNAAMLRLDARRIAAATEASADRSVDADGAPLATVLANLKLADDPAVARITEALRELVPEFRALRVIPASVATPQGERAGYRLEFDMDSGRGIAAEDISEGTLLLLALLSVLYAPSRPRLLLLDAIDSHLHPTAQVELARLLQKLVAADGRLQVIASTHSPFVVDVAEPAAVLVFAKGPDGSVGVRPLSQHPEAARFQAKLSSGQLWTLDNESDWVFGATK